MVTFSCTLNPSHTCHLELWRDLAFWFPRHFETGNKSLEMDPSVGEVEAGRKEGRDHRQVPGLPSLLSPFN